MARRRYRHNGAVEPAIEIRAAGRSDIGPLLDLYRQLHPDDPPLALPEAVTLWERSLLYPGSEILIGVKDGEIVSTCALVVVPNLTRGGRPYALIENVVTASSQRKRGFGAAVMKAAIAAAWRQDCYKVMLLTGTNDPATLKFYHDAGFEQNKTGFQIRRSAGRPTDSRRQVC